jgi:hypothetical protein
MKKTILLLLLIAACGTLSAQITKIPEAVTTAFKTKYPDAQDVGWRAENTDFLTTFTLNGIQKTAHFSSNGEWKETDTKLTFDSLPAPVKAGFQKSKYATWKQGSITYVDNSKTQWYEIYVANSSLAQSMFLYFNGQGQLVMGKPAM